MNGLRLVVVLLCMLLSRVSFAEDPLVEAAQLMGEAKFKDALMIVNRLLLEPDSDPETLAEAFRLRGLCLAGQGRPQRAIKAFQRFLAIKPSYRLPISTSPKMRWPFFKALSMPGQEPISLTHKPPEPPDQLMGLELKAVVGTNPFEMIKNVRLKYQLTRGVQWITLSESLKKPGPVTFMLPAGSEDRQVWYYFEAANQYGGTLARAGNQDEPFHLECTQAPEPIAAAAPEKPKPSPKEPTATASIAPKEPPKPGPEGKPKPLVDKTPKLEAKVTPKPQPVVPLPEEKPDQQKKQDKAWYTTWWFWTAVGVVTAGVVTGVVLGVSGDGESNEMIYDIVLQ